MRPRRARSRPPPGRATLRRSLVGTSCPSQRESADRQRREDDLVHLVAAQGVVDGVDGSLLPTSPVASRPSTASRASTSSSRRCAAVSASSSSQVSPCWIGVLGTTTWKVASPAAMRCATSAASVGLASVRLATIRYERIGCLLARRSSTYVHGTPGVQRRIATRLESGAGAAASEAGRRGRVGRRVGRRRRGFGSGVGAGVGVRVGVAAGGLAPGSSRRRRRRRSRGVGVGIGRCRRRIRCRRRGPGWASGSGVGVGSTGGPAAAIGRMITQRWYHSDGPRLGATELRSVPAVHGSSYGLSVSR